MKKLEDNLYGAVIKTPTKKNYPRTEIILHDKDGKQLATIFMPSSNIDPADQLAHGLKLLRLTG